MIKKIFASALILVILFLLIYFVPEMHWKLEYKNSNRTIFALNDFYKACGRFPTTAEGLALLKQNSPCDISGWVAPAFEFENGYGTKMEYESDGKKFKLVVKGIFGDVIRDESMITGAHE